MLCNHRENGDDDVRTHIVYRNMRRSEDVRSRKKKRAERKEENEQLHSYTHAKSIQYKCNYK